MVKEKYNRADTIVFWVYVIGILVAIMVAAIPYILPIIARFRSLDILTIHRKLRLGFFIGSVSHVILLAVLSFSLTGIDKLVAGSKVQTAGYLHTLVAFVLIFAQVENEFTLDVVLYPMGAALITSILGWFIGGEIVGRIGTKGVSLENEAGKLASELEGFTHAIHKIHENYTNTLHKANKEFNALHKEQSKMYNKVSKLSETAENLIKTLDFTSNSIKENLGSNFEKSIVNISGKFTKLANEVEKSTDSAKDVSEYLKQSQVLIKQLEALLDLVTKKF